MSILTGARKPAPEPIIVTICGTPGSGKSSLAASFPQPFMIRTTGEASPRDVSAVPDELGETTTEASLWDQIKALIQDDHNYQSVIFDSITGLEAMFIAELLEKDKAKSIQQAGGGYGAGRDMVAVKHARVRRGAEALKKRGMNVVFLAHSDIARIEPPDSDGYSQYTLRLHAKSMAPYVDMVDVVGFIRQNTVLIGDERKRAITDDERVIQVTLNPSAVTKNRLGITEDLPFVQGENPLAPWLAVPAAKKSATKKEDSDGE